MGDSWVGQLLRQTFTLIGEPSPVTDDPTALRASSIWSSPELVLDVQWPIEFASVPTRTAGRFGHAYHCSCIPRQSTTLTAVRAGGQMLTSSFSGADAAGTSLPEWMRAAMASPAASAARTNTSSRSSPLDKPASLQSQIFLDTTYTHAVS